MKTPSHSICFIFLSALALAIAVVTGCAQAAPPPLTISAPGHTTALIVGDDWALTFGRNPLRPESYLHGPDSGPQHILRQHFKDITGQAAVIVKASQVATAAQREKYQTRIWCDRQSEVERVLGDDLAKLNDDGFIIRAQGNDLYLSGKNWWGSVWASYDLLERYAGCGWYGQQAGASGPLALGALVVIPKNEKIAVPSDANVVEQPDYRSRFVRHLPWTTFRLLERDKFHHNLSNIISPEKYAKTHPEYFPIIDGERWIPPADRSVDFQPNIAEPGVLKLVADAAIEYFDSHPNAGSFSIAMNDSAKFCDSDECLAVVPPQITDKRQRIAYAFFDFYNKVAERVAKKHPQKRLGLLAYGWLSLLPEKSIQLHPMLVPYVALDSAQLFDKPIVDIFQPRLDKWHSFSQHVGVYEYVFGGGFLIPRIYNRYLMPNIKRQYGVGSDGFYAEAYPNWGLDGPKYWLMAKLLWDTDQDPKALLDEYYRKMFGPAAGEMRQYFDYLEEVWVTQQLEGQDRADYRWFQDPKHLKIFSPEKCDRAWALLQAAEKKTTDPEVLARLKYFRDSFALVRTLSYRVVATEAADAAMPNSSVEPDEAALKEWMPKLLHGVSLWQQAPDLEKTVADVRALQPPALNIATWNMLRAGTKAPIGAMKQTSQRLNEITLQKIKEDKKPLTHENINAGVSDILKDYAKDKTDAVRQLQTLAEQDVVIAPTAAKAPVVDGTINAGEWPQPIFDGQFYEFDSLKKQQEKSTFYAVRNEETLYLAFDFEQDPKTVGGQLMGVDNSGWRKPAMLGDDAVVVNFIARGHYLQSLRINPNGAIGTVDNQPKNEKWQNAVQTKARKTATGWQVEIAIDMKSLQVPSAELNKKTLLLPVARYTRRALPQKGNEPVKYQTDISTLVPAQGGARSYPSGNFTTLMSFKDGPILLFGNP